MIEISLGTNDETVYLTEKELEAGKIYGSSINGSREFLFVKFKDVTYAFSKGSCIIASNSHGRDFYLAPKDSYVTIKND